MPRTGRPPAFTANPFILLDPEDQHLLERQWVVQFGGRYLGGYPTRDEAEAVRRKEWEAQVGAI